MLKVEVIMEQLKRLFLCMFKVGCIGFGGGNALIPFIEKEVVTKYKLVSREELNKYVVTANITPGALPVEVAVLLGKTVAGVPGMLLAPICIVLPGVFMTILLLTVFSKFSQGAIQQVEFISVGISVYIMYLLYQYNYKVVSEFELQSMKLKRMAVIITILFFTCGKEIYHIFGIEKTPLFDISTVNVLLLSFFVIFSSGKKMTKKKFIFDAIVVVIYVLCVGKTRVIQSEYVLFGLRIIMFLVAVLGIFESMSGTKKKKTVALKSVLKEEFILIAFMVLCAIPTVLLLNGVILYIGKGFVSSLISFGGGEAYLTVAESMFLDCEINDEQLYSRLLPVVNALPGSVLTKLLSGIGYYTGVNGTGSKMIGILTACAGLAVSIAASGAVVCAVTYIYEMFEDLKIFDLLRKCIRPIVGGLLLSTGLSLFYEVQKNMQTCNWNLGGTIIGVGVMLAMVIFLKKKKRIPDSVLVVLCGVISLMVCNLSI